MREKLSSNEEAIGEFYEKFERKVMEINLRPGQIYNYDETTLVYKILYDKTLIHNKEKMCVEGEKRRLQ